MELIIIGILVVYFALGFKVVTSQAIRVFHYPDLLQTTVKSEIWFLLKWPWVFAKYIHYAKVSLPVWEDAPQNPTYVNCTAVNVDRFKLTEGEEKGHHVYNPNPGPKPKAPPGIKPKKKVSKAAPVKTKTKKKTTKSKPKNSKNK